MYPIKWDQELKVSGSTTEARLMVKCCVRKTTKKDPKVPLSLFGQAMILSFHSLVLVFQQIYGMDEFLTSFQHRKASYLDSF